MIRDISHLKHVKSLSTLKLNRNKLTDAKEVIDVLKQLPNLKTLYLKGNPFVRKLKDYRKEIIHACPSLEFLDDRPVYDWEKKFVSAWKIGGKEGLEKERERHNKEKWGAIDRNMIKWKQARMEMKAKLDAERAAEEKRKKNEETQDTAPRIKVVVEYTAAEVVDFTKNSNPETLAVRGSARTEEEKYYSFAPTAILNCLVTFQTLNDATIMMMIMMKMTMMNTMRTHTLLRIDGGNRRF